MRGKRHTTFVQYNTMKHSNFNIKFQLEINKHFIFMNELSVESQETMNHSKPNLKDAHKSMSRTLQTNPPTVTLKCASKHYVYFTL